MSITNCLACAGLFETTEEEANWPGPVCTPCHHLGHCFDDDGHRVAFPTSTATIARDNISDSYTEPAIKVGSDTVSEQLPTVVKALKAAHIASVRIDYARGSVQEPRYYTAQWLWATPRVPAAIQDEVLSFFKALIARRFPTGLTDWPGSGRSTGMSQLTSSDTGMREAGTSTTAPYAPGGSLAETPARC